jgi:hypothetical protein
MNRIAAPGSSLSFTGGSRRGGDQVSNAKLLENLMRCKPEDVRSGMSLTMVCEDRTDEVTPPQWASG